MINPTRSGQGTWSRGHLAGVFAGPVGEFREKTPRQNPAVHPAIPRREPSRRANRSPVFFPGALAGLYETPPQSKSGVPPLAEASLDQRSARLHPSRFAHDPVAQPCSGATLQHTPVAQCNVDATPEASSHFRMTSTLLRVMRTSGTPPPNCLPTKMATRGRWPTKMAT
jgi:hypothetical protein